MIARARHGALLYQVGAGPTRAAASSFAACRPPGCTARCHLDHALALAAGVAQRRDGVGGVEQQHSRNARVHRAKLAVVGVLAWS
jgi:hypothetical protein